MIQNVSRSTKGRGIAPAQHIVRVHLALNNADIIMSSQPVFIIGQ